VPAVGKARRFVTDEEVREVAVWQNSKVLGERERTAIEYAEQMTHTPVSVSNELFERLKKHFTDDQIVELTASIACENYRARFNHALHIESDNLFEEINI
jgi:alkylhydroperoxidase family enzyme